MRPGGRGVPALCSALGVGRAGAYAQALDSAVRVQSLSKTSQPSLAEYRFCKMFFENVLNFEFLDIDMERKQEKTILLTSFDYVRNLFQN